MNTLADWLPVYIGLGVAIVAVGLGSWWIRRTREQRGEEPPDQAKLLRPPGYWLQQQLERNYEDLLTTILHLMASFSLAGLIAIPLFTLVRGFWLGKHRFSELMAMPNSYTIPLALTAGVICILWIVWSIRRFFRLAEESRKYHLGLRGEMATAEALRPLEREGYTVFHDVPGDGAWNIDHLVIGPTGVFVIETKTRHRRNPTRNQAKHEVTFDAETIFYPWCQDPNAI